MSIIHDSRFQVTTVWPELINKRIKTVDIQLKESQLTNRDNQLLVNGIIQRRVSYLDFDGRNRKTEDRLQFEIIARNLEPYQGLERFEIELRQDYFIFQPRRVGENQAIFEHGFGIIIHRKIESAPVSKSQTISQMLANIIHDQGAGSVVISQPVFFKETTAEPVSFRGEIVFTGEPEELPLLSGLIKSTITIVNKNELLSETKFEFPFQFISSIPKITPGQYFSVQGSFSDSVWQFDNSIRTWRLEGKLEYFWRITEEKEVTCITPFITNPENQFTIEAPLRLKELNAKIPKNISFSMPGLHPVELRLNRQTHDTYINRKGILVKIELNIEIYGINEQGREVYLEHPVDFNELIPINLEIQPLDDIIPVIRKLDSQLIDYRVENNFLKIRIVIDSQIRLYQKNLIEIGELEEATSTILGKVIKDQKVFSLQRAVSLQLKSKPDMVQELKIRNTTIKTQNREGWLNIRGEMELGVTYLDEQRCLREDTFPVFFQENYLWDKLRISDEVLLQSRLDYDAYTLSPRDPRRLSYRFLLSLSAQCRYNREFKINIFGTSSDSSREGFQMDIIDNFLELSKKPTLHRLPEGFQVFEVFRTWSNWFEVEADVPLALGKAREIQNGRFNIEDFSYRKELDVVLIEGNLYGELDYWDSEGYLRSEPLDCNFWKCFRNNRFPDTQNIRIIPELHQLRFFPVRTSFFRKGRVKITFRVEVKQIIEGEEDPG